jgi:acyl dehydratase
VTRTTKLSLIDPPDTWAGNPIHSPLGGEAAGYGGALVAGIHLYGWACSALLRHLGEGWLERGWVDVRFRRPVYPGELMVTTVDAARTFTVAGETGPPRIEGEAGLGDAPVLAELDRPVWLEPQPPVANPERMVLGRAPVGEDFRPMAVDASYAAASDWVRYRLVDDDPRWHHPEAVTALPPPLHPAFLAGRMTPLFKHSYLYGPAIHVRSQIQHLHLARSGQTLAVGARLHAAYDRKGHHHHVSDCLIVGEDGTPLTHLRHTGIFRVADRLP